MRVVPGIAALEAGIPFVAAIGVFDGVHLGHRGLIGRLVATAREVGATPLVVTFDPHPQLLLSGRTPELLCSVEERVRRLGALGVEIVVVQPFTTELRMLSADAFLDRLAAGRDLRGLVLSPESGFGHDRGGTLTGLAPRAARDDWRLEAAPLVEVDGTRVSSRRIRALLDAGDRAAAEALLGGTPRET